MGQQVPERDNHT